MVNPTKEKKNPNTTFEDQMLEVWYSPDVEQFVLDFGFILLDAGSDFCLVETTCLRDMGRTPFTNTAAS